MVKRNDKSDSKKDGMFTQSETLDLYLVLKSFSVSPMHNGCFGSVIVVTFVNDGCLIDV